MNFTAEQLIAAINACDNRLTAKALALFCSHEGIATMSLSNLEDLEDRLNDAAECEDVMEFRHQIKRAQRFVNAL